MLILGTLSKDDEDGSETVGKKMNLRSFKLNRVHLDLLNMPNTGDFSWSWILKGFYSGSKRGRKIRRRMSTSSIKRQIRRLHDVVVQWTSKKCTKKRDARAEVLFWSLNLLFFWSRRCGRRRSCLSSLLWFVGDEKIAHCPWSEAMTVLPDTDKSREPSSMIVMHVWFCNLVGKCGAGRHLVPQRRCPNWECV